MDKKIKTKTKWAVRLLYKWLKQRCQTLNLECKKDEIDILKINKKDFDECLKYFVAEVRNE